MYFCKLANDETTETFFFLKIALKKVEREVRIACFQVLVKVGAPPEDYYWGSAGPPCLGLPGPVGIYLLMLVDHMLLKIKYY